MSPSLNVNASAFTPASSSKGPLKQPVIKLTKKDENPAPGFARGFLAHTDFYKLRQDRREEWANKTSSKANKTKRPRKVQKSKEWFERKDKARSGATMLQATAPAFVPRPAARTFESSTARLQSVRSNAIPLAQAAPHTITPGGDGGAAWPEQPSGVSLRRRRVGGLEGEVGGNERSWKRVYEWRWRVRGGDVNVTWSVFFDQV